MTNWIGAIRTAGNLGRFKGKGIFFTQAKEVGAIRHRVISIPTVSLQLVAGANFAGRGQLSQPPFEVGLGNGVLR